MDTRFRCYRGFVSGFRGFRNPRQTGKQRDARGEMTPFRSDDAVVGTLRGRHATRNARFTRRTFFLVKNTESPGRACTTDPSHVRSHYLFQSTRSKSRRRFREVPTISESRAAVVVSCHVAVPLENVRGTPSRRTRWLARASAPLCPSRRGLEARRAVAATRTPRWPLSRDPIWGSARAAARWWRLPRPLTVARPGARPPPRPGPRTPRRRPPWRRT